MDATSTTTVDELANLIAVAFEKFKEMLPLSILMHVEEVGREDLMTLALLADFYYCYEATSLKKGSEGLVLM